MTRPRSFWGWGYADRFPSDAERRDLGAAIASMLGFEGRVLTPPRIEDVSLRSPRVPVPDTLASFVTEDPHARVHHTYGKGYRDIQRGFTADFAPAPDLVARPRSEADIEAVFDWAAKARVAVIPFGGGSSVVGGVEANIQAADHQAALSLDLGSLDQVLEVERSSLHARIQAGALGPALESQLAAHGLTLRHFPQSFEHSSLGGWIATRAGGHFATVYTHIDDLVASLRMLTPSGVMESRRLPGSGAGPSPDRLMLGSEGILGVITEAWMRVRPRPTYRATATVLFNEWSDAVAAVRALSQSGLYPSNCRLLDSREAALNFVTGDGSHVLIVAFESPDHPLQPWMDRALVLCADHGGRCPDGPVHREGQGRAGEQGGAGAWKSAFVDAPYLMNVLVSLGFIVDTFETAIPWDRFDALHTAVMERMGDAMHRVCGAGSISCRFTHVYPDGPAPYYTFIAPSKPGGELAQWAELKRVASDTLIEMGATITHHHAVGRLHRPWYERQRPEPFAAALRAAKATLDPSGILNPGVLI
jgi:alkyldihydroxyacetonephosphate synthase